MRIYDFTLVFSPGTELTEELGNALFEAGCDDGSPGSCKGIVAIDFHREAESLERAIRSAIVGVQNAGCTVARAKIDADAPAIQNV